MIFEFMVTVQADHVGFNERRKKKMQIISFWQFYHNAYIIKNYKACNNVVNSFHFPEILH